MPIMSTPISFFRETFETECTKTITFKEYFDLVRSGYWSERVLKIRATDDYDKRSRLKQKMPSVVPAGIFRKRLDSEMISDFTGVIVLDLDRKGNEGINFNHVARDAVGIDSTLAVHRSVGGDGLAIYVMVDRWCRNTYNYARLYYEIMLGVVLDKATCNLSRIRYVSYDPNLVISETVYELVIPEPIEREKDDYRGSGRARDVKKDELFDALVKTVIENGDDPTPTYDDWFKIGCGLANVYGAGGRDLFHYLSKNNSGYSKQATDRKFDSILAMGNWSVGKGTIVMILSKYQ